MNTNDSSALNPRNWLDTFAARSLGDIEMTPDLDLDLSRDAIVARHDRASRDRLLEALAWKVARFCARYARRSLDPWEFDDVQQEAFLTFIDVLESWTPLVSQDGPAGFGYYFLRVYPLRLASRVSMLRRRPATASQAGARLDPIDQTDIEDTVLVNQVIAEICGQLNALDQSIFQLAARDGLGPSRIADLTQISRRTIHRHWPAIVSIARERLREAS